jgi:O-antigen/teichoic acid export membrane protein
MMSELKEKSLKGVRWTTISAVIVGVGGLLQMVILTRLLDKSSFAMMGIVNVVLGLSTQLVDMGFSNAILREKNLVKSQLNTFYWLNVGLSLFFVCIFGFSAPWIAAFFPQLETEKLIHLLCWACPVFILSGLSMQYQTLLQKQLRFKTLSVMEIISFVAGFSTTLLMAMRGLGYFSLIGGVLAKAIVSSSILVASGIGHHRPGFQFSWENVRPVWKFSAYQSLEKIIAYIAVNFDTIMVTKLFDREVSGTYEVIKKLLIQPWYILSPLVTKVTYPVMAQVHDDMPRLRNIAMRSIQLVAVLNIPIYIGCVIGADLIVPVVFGSKWISGIEPFRWLALSYLLRSVLNPLGSVILAKGKGQLALIMQASAFVGLLIAIGVGLFYSLNGMLIALLIFNILLIIPIQIYIAKPLLESTFSDLWKQVHVELLFATLSFILVYALVAQWSSNWLSLLFYLITGGLLYLCGVLWKRPHLWADFKSMVPKKYRIFK